MADLLIQGMTTLFAGPTTLHFASAFIFCNATVSPGKPAITITANSRLPTATATLTSPPVGLLSAAATVTGTPTTVDGAGTSATYTLTVDGATRTVNTYAPTGLPSPCKVMFLLHGSNGAGTSMMGLAKIYAVADSYKFLVVAPDGVGGKWTPWGDPAKPNDYKFIDTILADLPSRFAIDILHTYVAGMSNGSDFAAGLAMARSQAFAAVSSVAGDYTQGTLAFTGPPTLPVPMLLFHGTADPIWNYNGFTAGGIVYPPTEASWVQWATWNNSYSGPVLGSAVTDPAGNGTSYQKKTYTNPDTGIDTILYTENGAGHVWPGGIQYAPKVIIGQANTVPNGSDLIWNFFASYSRTATSVAASCVLACQSSIVAASIPILQATATVVSHATVTATPLIPSQTSLVHTQFQVTATASLVSVPSILLGSNDGLARSELTAYPNRRSNRRVTPTRSTL